MTPVEIKKPVKFAVDKNQKLINAMRRYNALCRHTLASMIGYPTNKQDIEKEIKYQESIYKVLAVVPETAKSVYTHIEQLKAQLKALEDKETLPE